MQVKQIYTQKYYILERIQALTHTLICIRVSRFYLRHCTGVNCLQEENVNLCNKSERANLSDYLNLGTSYVEKQADTALL